MPLAAALRRVLSKGYGARHLKDDLMAGTVVGIVALPLSMALAIAVGVPPQHGLYTAILAGAATALLGGCKFQVTGPTAAFIVILAPIVTKHGLTGLLTAGFMAGLILIGMGVAKLGQLIQYIPYPVTTGFTSGIAVVIATLQIKDILGLEVAHMPDHYAEKLGALWAARGTFDPRELGVAAVTFALLLLVPKATKRVPAPLLAIGAATVGAAVLHALVPGFEVATIGSRFRTVIDGVTVAGIPRALPSPALPWGAGLPSWSLLSELMPSAFAIAMLGAIESLLSCVIADGMTQTRHEPNSELVGLGIGNLVAPLFGGIAATGALARTATNIRAGARSPLAAVWHAVIVLLAIVLLAPAVAFVPMASLAALLLLVAWNMSEVHHFVGVVRRAPKSDTAVLLACFFLTVVFDMVVAIGVGVVLAALLFMRRMAELTQARAVLQNRDEADGRVLPARVMLYEIAGPLFFGAASNAMSQLMVTRGDTFDVLVIDLSKVPVIDATGMVGLEQTVASMVRDKKTIVLAGPLPKPERIWERSKLTQTREHVTFTSDLQDALSLAERMVGERHSAPPGARKSIPG
ncbi:MAG: C4-dicarboxylic acid transporter DauA [Deltaproteobacteria bacterium]|nr:C4-dicarboxylic acid transporter DauA [Deltaproteobacteria bacterium]